MVCRVHRLATRIDCAAEWEQNASDHFDAVLGDPTALAAFLKAVPKGGDLHNHLTGAVYAETYLDWGRTPTADCVGSSSHTGGRALAVLVDEPRDLTTGTFFDAIVAAWFRCMGFVAGQRERSRSLLRDVREIRARRRCASRPDARRCRDPRHRPRRTAGTTFETMFNLAKNTGTLASSVSTGTITAADLPALYTAITTNAGFAAAISSDAATVAAARTGYRTSLRLQRPPRTPGCPAMSTSRFHRRWVSRTGRQPRRSSAS